MLSAVRALIPAVAGLCCFAAPDTGPISRIRDHMREYLARLPDYTCRVTIERFARRNPRSPFAALDRLRLDIAYASGAEYYAWPGDSRFEHGIVDLLPERGLVSNGSYALHTRKLFLTNDAQFRAPREAVCEGTPCIQVEYLVPALRSGYTIGAGGASAPAALRGVVWFERGSLDLLRLEVRVEDTPKSVPVAWTREVTRYARTRIGDVEFVLPAQSELLLRDRNGSERRNAVRFAEYHRYAGQSTVRYGTADGVAAAPAGPVREGRVPAGTRVSAVLEQEIPADAAVGDEFHANGGVVGRITDMKRAGERWTVEFTLLKVGADRAHAALRKTLALPVPAGVPLTWRVE